MSPWIKRVERGNPHVCKKPDLNNGGGRQAWPGDRWKCRKCKKVYEVELAGRWLRFVEVRSE